MVDLQAKVKTCQRETHGKKHRITQPLSSYFLPVFQEGEITTGEYL
jgi:hypothetical protein